MGEFVIRVKRGKKKPTYRRPGSDSGGAGSHVSKQLRSSTGLIIDNIFTHPRKKNLKSQQNSQVTPTTFTATAFEFRQTLGYQNDCPQSGNKPNHFVLTDGKNGEAGRESLSENN